MTAPKSLPARPSLESLRKQAKKLARDAAAGHADAIARARAQLPNVEPPLAQQRVQGLDAGSLRSGIRGTSRQRCMKGAHDFRLLFV